MSLSSLPLGKVREPRRPHRETWFMRATASLLDQQLWCFGRDIRHSDGNLLIRFGFERSPAPNPVTESSAYLLRGRSGCQTVLWGFGLFYGEEGYGGIFLRRYASAPRWTVAHRVPECVWKPEGLSSMNWPCNAQEQALANHLFEGAAAWLAEYEEWVLNIAGIDYRHACLRRWTKKFVAPELVPQEWRRIAAAIKEGFVEKTETRKRVPLPNNFKTERFQGKYGIRYRNKVD